MQRGPSSYNIAMETIQVSADVVDIRGEQFSACSSQNRFQFKLQRVILTVTILITVLI